jgi:hypothetical protein
MTDRIIAAGVKRNHTINQDSLPGMYKGRVEFVWVAFIAMDATAENPKIKLVKKITNSRSCFIT